MEIKACIEEINQVCVINNYDLDLIVKQIGYEKLSKKSDKDFADELFNMILVCDKDIEVIYDLLNEELCDYLY